MRMSLNGVEVAAKISGKFAERLAVLLYAVLRDQKKTRGKIRLTNMLKSEKELKVFAVKDDELKQFCDEAKKYGVLYCVLKDTNADDGLTDIMVRADDASKVNRIFQRFGLATIDMASLKTEIQQRPMEQANDGEEKPTPERSRSVDDRVDKFLDAVVKPERENPTAEQPENENPTTARTAKSRQSEPSSENRKSRNGEGVPDRESERSRPSVREEMREIRESQRQKPKEADKERGGNEHIHIPKKKKNKEVR